MFQKKDEHSSVASGEKTKVGDCSGEVLMVDRECKKRVSIIPRTESGGRGWWLSSWAEV